MAIEFEKIKSWDGQSGTGADNRGVIDRNFEKVKGELEGNKAEIVQLAGEKVSSENITHSVFERVDFSNNSPTLPDGFTIENGSLVFTKADGMTGNKVALIPLNIPNQWKAGKYISMRGASVFGNESSITLTFHNSAGAPMTNLNVGVIPKSGSRTRAIVNAYDSSTEQVKLNVSINSTPLSTGAKVYLNDVVLTDVAINDFRGLIQVVSNPALLSDVTTTQKALKGQLNRGGFDNLFNHIDGEVGSIWSGADAPDNSRYRSNFFRVNVDGVIDISIEDEYHFVVTKYDLNKKYISTTASYTTTYNVTEDAFYRIIVKRKDSATLSVLDIKNIYQSVYVFLLYKDAYKIKDLTLTSAEKIQQIGGLNYSENAPVEISINERIFQGSYYGDSHRPGISNRLASDAIETIPFNKLTINCESDFLFDTLFLDERNNTAFNSGYTDSFSGIISHKYFRIVIKRKDEANISPSDLGDVGLVITQSEVNYKSVSASSAGTSVSSDSYLNSILKEVYLNIEEYDPLKRYWLDYINFVDGQLTTLYIAKTDLDGSNLERFFSFRFKDLTQSGLFSNADGTILFEKNNFNGLITADNKVELNKNIFDINTQPTIKRFNKGGRWSDFLENSKILSAKTFGRVVKENEGEDIFVMPFTSDLHSVEKMGGNPYYRGFTWMYADLVSYLTETYNCDASANLGDAGFDTIGVDNVNTLMAQVGRASQTSKPFFFSVGNHETFANQPNSLDSKMFTHSLRKPTYEKFEMNTSNSNIYCEYYDDTNKNVRIITLNTYLGRTIYIPYLVNALSTTPDDYSILILQHEPPYVEISALPNVDINYAEERQILEDFVAKRAGVSTNSTYDFSSQNSKIAGLLCGHIHESIGKTINGVNVYATGGLGMAGNYAAVGARDENMMLGIDIFADIAVINSSNSMLKIYRVGKNDIDGSVDVEFTF